MSRPFLALYTRISYFLCVTCSTLAAANKALLSWLESKNGAIAEIGRFNDIYCSCIKAAVCYKCEKMHRIFYMHILNGMKFKRTIRISSLLLRGSSLRLEHARVHV
jgi:hypothetical protein